MYLYLNRYNLSKLHCNVLDNSDYMFLIVMDLVRILLIPCNHCIMKIESKSVWTFLIVYLSSKSIFTCLFYIVVILNKELINNAGLYHKRFFSMKRHSLKFRFNDCLISRKFRLIDIVREQDIS